ncbi:MAG TPA: M48 family metalloprotease [Oligoflexus sp.]|uniref:M48 family metalloprotease n=1 Tax=Oligoflexus sp. TaxID=1971216 RepID=UPI002D70B558|nr:M48 family metalloprotease [Oligoflexus sp.]HYX35831.1 M48 family metalloprotease [Oligoflexus sp.]
MKNLIVFRLAVVTATFAMFPSCAESPNSEVKHIYGVTSHAFPNADLGNCIEQKTNYPELREYLKAIMMHITKSNPKTFSGRFSADKYCIEVNPSKEKNASASKNGKIEFNVGIFQALDNDAAVAAIMSHELAHLTMAHGLRAIDDLFSTDPEIKSLQSQIDSKTVASQKTAKDGMVVLRALFKKRPTSDNSALKSSADKVIKLESVGEAYSALLDAYTNYFVLVMELSDPALGSAKVPNPYTAAEVKQVQDLFLSVFRQNEAIRSLTDSLLAKRKAKGATPEELANWSEQEADEVGFELYVKSGFKPDHFTDLFSHLIKSKGGIPSLKECENKLEANQIPDRGLSSHPANCWRIYDVKKAEKDRHAKEYDSYYKTNTTVDLFPGRLNGIKQKLQ